MFAICRAAAVPISRWPGGQVARLSLSFPPADKMEAREEEDVRRAEVRTVDASICELVERAIQGPEEAWQQTFKK